MMALDAARVLDVVAGVAFLALGAWVGWRRGRNRAALSFAALCLGFGVLYLHGSKPQTTHELAPLTGLALLAAFLLLFGGAAGLVVLVPRPLARRDRAAIVGGALALALLLGKTAYRLVETPGWWTRFDGLGPGVSTALALVLHVAVLIMHAGLVAAPLRFAAAEGHAERRTLGLLAVGLTLVLSGELGVMLDALANPWLGARSWLVLVLSLLAPVPLWIFATRGPDPRLARNVAIAIPSILLGATLLGLVARPYVYPVGRVLGVTLLGYAVLRGQIHGLDAHARFAVSRSTIAAAFVAAFFLASEGAQLVLGAANPWVGLLGAGALVFALAPLQRAAERLAEKAVPLAEASATAPSPPASKQEEAYRRAVRLALRDRVLRREEEIQLFHVAEALGVPAGRAMELRHEVERELSGDAGAA